MTHDTSLAPTGSPEELDEYEVVAGEARFARDYTRARRVPIPRLAPLAPQWWSALAEVAACELTERPV